MSGVTSVDDRLECLKPGRKKGKRLSSPECETLRDLELPTSVVSDIGDSDTMSVFGADGSDVTRKRYPHVKQMAINELRDLGLKADDLRRLGVNVVNPEGVAKMLK